VNTAFQVNTELPVIHCPLEVTITANSIETQETADELASLIPWHKGERFGIHCSGIHVTVCIQMKGGGATDTYLPVHVPEVTIPIQ